jgi:hypothetical protein
MRYGPGAERATASRRVFKLASALLVALLALLLPTAAPAAAQGGQPGSFAAAPDAPGAPVSAACLAQEPPAPFVVLGG